MQAFLDFLRRLFGFAPPVPTDSSKGDLAASRHPHNHANKTPKKHMRVPEKYRLQVSKAIEQIAFATRSYDLPKFRAAGEKNQWIHDLGLMLAHDDLADVRLELLGDDDTVVAKMEIAFDGEADGKRHADHADGIELPMIEINRVKRCRAVVRRRDRAGGYEDLLRGSWSSAEALPERDGSDYSSEHARRISGGRQSGRFFAEAAARHYLEVTRTGDREYAFARDLDLGADVFLHPGYASDDVGRFQCGQELTALVVQTRRGLQARAIEPA
jgi:cold shock CspA family protein